MTLLTLTAAVLIVVGQQRAPLVGQRELAPPSAAPAAQQAAPAQPAPQVQPPAQVQVTQQQPNNAPPVAETPPAPRPEAQVAPKSSGLKRVVAFWVVLPEKSK